MHKLFWAGAIVLAPAVLFAVACSSTPTTDGGPDGAAVCPTTLLQAVTVGGDGGEGTNNSCHIRGDVCPVAVTCGQFIQQASCTCDLPDGGGPLAYDCVLTANGTLVPADPAPWKGPNDPSGSFCEPVLPPNTDGGGGCLSSPAANVGLDGGPASCNAAGEICYYKGVICPADQVPQKIDTCQCNANVTGDAGLSWVCEVQSCN